MIKTSLGAIYSTAWAKREDYMPITIMLYLQGVIRFLSHDQGSLGKFKNSAFLLYLHIPS